jgi:hypothetical protein
MGRRGQPRGAPFKGGAEIGFKAGIGGIKQLSSRDDDHVETLARRQQI